MDKYLPIGTVVLLKGADKKVMISGYYVVVKETGETFDYQGCLYPEGYISEDRILVFNHDKIDKIYHLGYINNEQEKFEKKLKDKINVQF